MQKVQCSHPQCIGKRQRRAFGGCVKHWKIISFPSISSMIYVSIKGLRTCMSEVNRPYLTSSSDDFEAINYQVLIASAANHNMKNWNLHISVLSCIQMWAPTMLKLYKNPVRHIGKIIPSSLTSSKIVSMRPHSFTSLPLYFSNISATFYVL